MPNAAATNELHFADDVMMVAVEQTENVSDSSDPDDPFPNSYTGA